MSFSIRATARYIPMSPRKVRLVVDLVRGRPAEEAAAILRLSHKAAAKPVGKVLASALANAEESYGLGRDELYVAEIFADEGPTAKRGRFGARGRWKPLRKRSCHITVALREAVPAAETEHAHPAKAATDEPTPKASKSDSSAKSGKPAAKAQSGTKSGKAAGAAKSEKGDAAAEAAKPSRRRLPGTPTRTRKKATEE